VAFGGMEQDDRKGNCCDKRRRKRPPLREHQGYAYRIAPERFAVPGAPLETVTDRRCLALLVLCHAWIDGWTTPGAEAAWKLGPYARWTRVPSASST
jgi:hypothetical protein